jgi:uncharacterized delta-60 repeat protein
MNRAEAPPCAHHRIPLLVVATLGVLPLALAAGVAARPGDLDPTFSRNGIVRVQDPEQIRKLSDPSAIDIGEHGRILIAGTKFTTETVMPAIARYRSNGKLDRSFNNDGYAAVPPDLGLGTDAIALADGQLLICGDGLDNGDPGRQQALILARVLPNGEPDPSFGDGGHVVVSSTLFHHREPPAPKMELAPGGDIVVAFRAAGNDFGVLRLSRNGELETEFGRNGIKTVGFPVGNEQRPRDFADLTIDRRGRIALSGTLRHGSGSSFGLDFGVVRLKPSGRRDRGFAGDGRKIFDVGRRDFSAAIESRRNGHLLVNGVVGPRRLALFELKQNGSLDRSFGTNGVRTTRLGTDGGEATELALQRGGRAVVFGLVAKRGRINTDFVVLRYTKRGKLDRTFSGNGRTIVDVSLNDLASDLTLQPNGRIVALGQSQNRRMPRPSRVLLRFKG